MSMFDINLSSDATIPDVANASICENFLDDDLCAQTASFSSNNQPAPFRLLGSAALPTQHASSAVVVSCPHAGRYYPDALINAGAIVVAERNTISGSSEGSGFGIRSSFVTANDNVIGPIGGWNGIWIYGESDVSAENNTILNTAKEPVLIGEYHLVDLVFQNLQSYPRNEKNYE